MIHINNSHSLKLQFQLPLFVFLFLTICLSAGRHALLLQYATMYTRTGHSNTNYNMNTFFDHGSL